jgi:hypothetical protein
MNSRPRNFIFASGYAASDVTRTLRTVTATATTMEFLKKLRIGSVSSTFA